jgi:hypothetical protein
VLTPPDAAAAQGQRVLVRKLNLALVQILKQEWPAKWPGFIPEIVASSRTSEVWRPWGAGGAAPAAPLTPPARRSRCARTTWRFCGC